MQTVGNLHCPQAGYNQDPTDQTGQTRLNDFNASSTVKIIVSLHDNHLTFVNVYFNNILI